MDALNSSKEFFLVTSKRFGLILILTAIIHAVTSNFFQPTFVHFAIFYCSCAVLSVIIYQHKTGGVSSFFLYALFGLGLALLRTSDLINHAGSRILGFLLIFSIGLGIVLLTVGLDVLLIRREVKQRGV